MLTLKQYDTKLWTGFFSTCGCRCLKSRARSGLTSVATGSPFLSHLYVGLGLPFARHSHCRLASMATCASLRVCAQCRCSTSVRRHTTFVRRSANGGDNRGKTAQFKFSSANMLPKWQHLFWVSTAVYSNVITNTLLVWKHLEMGFAPIPEAAVSYFFSNSIPTRKQHSRLFKTTSLKG